MTRPDTLWRDVARLVALVLLLTAAACAPFQPEESAAEGVTLAATADGVYTLTADPAVERVFLRFPGDAVTVEQEGCSVVAGAVECILGTTTEVSITVGGTVTLPPDRPAGVVCREECYALYLTTLTPSD